MRTFAQKQDQSQKPAPPSRLLVTNGQDLHPVLRLQGAVGNQAVLGMLRGGVLQRKLAITSSGDIYEQEAERVAAEVTRTTPGPIVQRRCACGGIAGPDGECAACRAKHLARQHRPASPIGPGVTDQVTATPAYIGVSRVPPHIRRFSEQSNGQMGAAPASVDQALASHGRPLEPSLRRDMEQRFGYDFSTVRVHSGGVAERSAQDVNAHAYTVGHNIVFGTGRFNLGSDEGRRLLAHELTHVVQQANDGLRVQRFVDCKPARLSMEDCPLPREHGEVEREVERARSGPMFFLGYNDPVAGVNGALIANFDIGSSHIKSNLPKDVEWGRFVRTGPSTPRSRWMILGFTDCQGPDRLNSKLREQRARAVFDILPSPVQALIDSHGPAPMTECITDNTDPGDRTLNRSVLLQPLSYEEKFEPYAVPSSPLEEPHTENCSETQRGKLTLAFNLAKLMVRKALSLTANMKKGSPEELLLIKYFGKDAWDSLNFIRRTYQRMLNEWDPNITLSCQRADNIVDSAICSAGTEGYTGLTAGLSGGKLGSLLICDYAFSTYAFSKTDLPETILHEMSHALEWTFDKDYCSRGYGCSLDTDEAKYNADSYSAFAGEALDRWGP